ncbi:hypothetical protein C7N43_31365 [Sphingobacteriales bacterium UPWRP_1]|nr:hypothetical protein BVG80_01675 [Sphingobacteriales bacterium TSM_CSM]PSJ72996.1 hypothetical protein C7N43_31365 [Sphingobacteriales bacterium UPWRP_1]
MPNNAYHTEENYYSSEVSDILTQIPGRLIRWGITIIFLTITILLLLTWFIQYPDVVNGRMVLSSKNAPAPVVCRSNGALHLFLPDKANVESGDAVAVIQNTANYHDVLALKNTLLIINPDYLSGLARLTAQGWQLGELQPYLNDLIAAIKKQQLSGTSGAASMAQQEFIAKQIAEHKNMSQNLNRQLESRQQTLYAARNNYNTRYLPLYQQGAISKTELEQQERELQQKENEMAELNNAIDRNNSQIYALEREISELGFSQSDNLNEVKSRASDAWYLLNSQIGMWEDRYLLKSPVKGILNYTGFIKENTYVKSDQEIAAIVPQNGKQNIYGELFIPQSGAGKVREGQAVQIVPDSYPKKEFGMVMGKVTAISDVSADGLYKIEVALPHNLNTTAGKTLAFKHGMEANASIVTEKQRLIERFLRQLKLAFE